MTLEDKDKWMEFYTLCDELYELAPWDSLEDRNILSYASQYTESLYYGSVVGHFGKLKGLILFKQNDINKYIYLLENKMPPLMLLNYQNGLMITFMDIKSESDEDHIIPKELGISFKDKWISIKTYEKGYLPYVPSTNVIDEFTDPLRNMLKMFEYVKDKTLEVPDYTKMISRFYEPEKKRFNTVVMDLLFPENRFYTDISNKKLDKSIKKSPKEDITVELEFNQCLPIPVGDNYEDNKYKLDYYFALADSTNKKMIEFDIKERKEYKTYESMLEYGIRHLYDWMKDNYKPDTICVRDHEMAKLIEELCKKHKIELKVTANLEIIDSFVSMLVKKQ